MVTGMSMAENKSDDLKIAKNKICKDQVIYTHNVILCLVDKLSVNTLALDSAIKKWYANAGQVFAILGRANPNQALDDTHMMMDNHFKLTTDKPA